MFRGHSAIEGSAVLQGRLLQGAGAPAAYPDPRAPPRPRAERPGAPGPPRPRPVHRVAAARRPARQEHRDGPQGGTTVRYGRARYARRRSPRCGAADLQQPAGREPRRCSASSVRRRAGQPGADSCSDSSEPRFRTGIVTEPAGRGGRDRAHRPASSPRRSRGSSVARSRSARSTPAPATAASSRSAGSPGRTTTSNVRRAFRRLAAPRRFACW